MSDAHRVMPRPDKAVISQASKLTPDHLRQLATLEWRSRTAAWPEYIAAGTELLTDKATDAEFRETRDAATNIVSRAQLPPEPETLAIQSIQQAALCAWLGDRVSRGTRMFLGRAWRALMKEVGETS